MTPLSKLTIEQNKIAQKKRKIRKKMKRGKKQNKTSKLLPANNTFILERQHNNCSITFETTPP